MERHPEPILHVDMDAFFASVEQRDDPALRGLPVVVGAAGGRGVVAAASYEARRFGIHSAMPMVRARRLCPELVIVGHHVDRYREASARVMEILGRVSPLVEPLSLDEAFVDVAGAVRLFGEPPVIGELIRAQVRREVDLPCSVGIGPTKSVAKLLSAKAKPDGLLHWRAEEVGAKLRPLPVADLWGAGPKTAERLVSFGFRTVGQLADADARTLQRVVGERVAHRLQSLARGEDPRRVVPHEPARSVSAERTFDEDVDDPVVLDRHLLALAEKVGRRMRRSGLACRTVTIKVRFASFETVTRSATARQPTDRTHDLVTVGRSLLEGLRLERVRVRLLGLGVSNLGDDAAAHQLALVAEEPEVEVPWTDRRWEDVERVADRVAERFGSAVSYAALLDTDDGFGRVADARDASDVEGSDDG